MVTIFYIKKIQKKEYVRILGGLTFYRICHICKSEENKENKKKTRQKEKKNTQHLPLLVQGMYKHRCVQKGAFLWAKYSFPSAT